MTSYKAARYGAGLAKKYNSDLIGVTVIDLMSLPYGYFLTGPETGSHDKIPGEKRDEVKNGWIKLKN